jgi:hydrogenase expression/formation protein HypC
LVPNLEIDDYVMVHAGFAIEKLDEEGARKTLEIINELDEVLEQD